MKLFVRYYDGTAVHHLHAFTPDGEPIWSETLDNAHDYSGEESKAREVVMACRKFHWRSATAIVIVRVRRVKPSIIEERLRSLETAANTVRGVTMHLGAIAKRLAVDDMVDPIKALSESLLKIDAAVEAFVKERE